MRYLPTCQPASRPTALCMAQGSWTCTPQQRPRNPDFHIGSPQMGRRPCPDPARARAATWLGPVSTLKAFIPVNPAAAIRIRVGQPVQTPVPVPAETGTPRQRMVVLAAADLDLPVGSQTDNPNGSINDRCGAAVRARRWPLAFGHRRRLNAWAQPTLAIARRTARTSRVLARRSGPDLGPSGPARTGPPCAAHLSARRGGRGVDRMFPKWCFRWPQKSAPEPDFCSVSGFRRLRGCPAMPHPEQAASHQATPNHIEQITAEPMTSSQREQAVAALAALITAWQHNYSEPGPGLRRTASPSRPGERH